MQATSLRVPVASYTSDDEDDRQRCQPPGMLVANIHICVRFDEIFRIGYVTLILFYKQRFNYRKVASSNTSLLEANTRRLFQIAYEEDFRSLCTA